MHANVMVVINVLVVVQDKSCENWVMLSLHGQLVLHIQPLMLTEGAKVDVFSTCQH